MKKVHIFGAALSVLVLGACASTAGYTSDERGAAMKTGDAVQIAAGSNQCLHGSLAVREESRADAYQSARFAGNTDQAASDAVAVMTFYQQSAAENATICDDASEVASALVASAQEQIRGE